MKMTGTNSVFKSIILAPFYHEKAPSSRPLLVSKVLSRLGKVDIVTSNFDHQTKRFKKQERSETDEKRKIYYIKTLRYKSNIGLSRLVSHSLFSIRATFFYLRRRNDYDLVYVTLPLNLLALLVFLFSRDKIKIADVVDIWPDVLPFPQKMKAFFYPVFALWKTTFQSAINKCDVLMAVSDVFFYDSIKYFRNDQQFARRFYLGHKELLPTNRAKEGIITIVYIGNIGHVYDFATLIAALSSEEIKAKYRLYLIGDGDKKAWLLNQLEKMSIKYSYFGVIYDENKLAEILGKSDIGFNGYINTTAAFSYKANTYMAAGLPILNSMKGDLYAIVERYGIGYNYSAGEVQSLRTCLRKITKHELNAMMKNSWQFFKNEIDEKIIMDKMESFIKKVKKEEKC